MPNCPKPSCPISDHDMCPACFRQDFQDAAARITSIACCRQDFQDAAAELKELEKHFFALTGLQAPHSLHTLRSPQEIQAPLTATALRPQRAPVAGPVSRA